MRRALILLAACSSPAPDLGVQVAEFPAVADRDVDLLIMNDNSNGAPGWEDAFGDAMTTLTDALAAQPGGLPDLHIGVVSSDLGTSPSLDGPPAPDIGQGQGACSGSGDAAALQTYGAPVDGNFIADVANPDGSRTTNYTGTLDEVMAQLIKSAGVNGCGFEQHLAATTHALTSPANAGFRRPDGNLVVLLMGDEDDCSVRDARFFDPGTAALGPLASYRCTHEGLVCDQAMDAGGAKTNCRPREDSPYVAGVQDAVDAVRAAAPPHKLLVEGIIGDPTPVAVELRPPPDGGAGVLALSHSCSYVDVVGGTVVADPGVRDAAFITALGGHWSTICTIDFSPYMTAIADDIRALIDGDRCITASIDAASCVAADVAPSGDRTPLPRCPAGGDCFDIVAVDSCPQLVAVTRLSTPDPDTRVEVSCDPP